MRAYDVSCYDKVSGKLAWGMTQKAESPIEAIAQACLAPGERAAFIQRMHDDGWDELPDLITDHPAYDMDCFEIRAEVIP